jgi:restriction endonuclease S subunit
MKLKIQDFSQIIPGYTFREAIESNKNGNAYVVQARNVKQDKSIKDITDLTRIEFQTLRSSSFVKKNDVLLLSRGMGAGTFRAGTYQANDNNVIAASSVHIIRITSSHILPHYLSLYLNSFEGQKAIEKSATGVHLQSVTRVGLADIEIPVPSIEQQQLLIQLNNNINEQHEITARKNDIYDSLMKATFKTLLAA